MAYSGNNETYYNASANYKVLANGSNYWPTDWGF